MKSLQLLFLLLCGTQLATATDVNKKYFLRLEKQRKSEIYQENMQNFKMWLQEHSKTYPQHSCLSSCDVSCRLGIFLAAKVLGNASEIMFPEPQTIDHKCFMKAPKDRAEFSSQSKTSQDSTNDGTDMNEDDGYVADDEYDDVDEQYAYLADHSAFAVWILDMLYNFKHRCCVEKKIIEQHKTELKNRLEPTFKPYQTSEYACKTIFVTDKTYVEEYKIEPHYQEEKLRVYKKTSNALKTNRVFVAMKRRVDEKDAKTRRAHQTKKSLKYRSSKNEFGNQRKAKKEIPLMAKDNFIHGIESKLGDVENMIRDVDTRDLKPAEIKECLKSCGFPAENISANWRKSQLMNKLKGVLNGKRDSLLNKLETSNPSEEKKEKVSMTKQKNVKNAERPIMMLGIGTDLYLTTEGYLVHAPKETEKTIFIVDHMVSQFVFKDKPYDVANICGNKMTYKNLLHSSGVEISFILSYEKIETTNMPHIGDVTVVGGNPITTVFMKIKDKLHEKRKVSDSIAKLFGEVNYWTTAHQKQTYQLWKPYFEKY